MTSASVDRSPHKAYIAEIKGPKLTGTICQNLQLQRVEKLSRMPHRLTRASNTLVTFQRFNLASGSPFEIRL